MASAADPATDDEDRETCCTAIPPNGNNRREGRELGRATRAPCETTRHWLCRVKYKHASLAVHFTPLSSVVRAPFSQGAIFKLST